MRTFLRYQKNRPKKLKHPTKEKESEQYSFQKRLEKQESSDEDDSMNDHEDNNDDEHDENKEDDDESVCHAPPCK
jgi:hypothetical protein